MTSSQRFYEAVNDNPFLPPLIIAVLALLAVWMLPKWQVRHLLSLTESERFACENESRKTIAQIIGGALLLAGLYFTAETLRLNQETLRATQERQVTEQYSRAVEQIGHSSLQVRLGGIYALERVAAESSRYQAIVSDVLSAFVRDRAAWAGKTKAPDPDWLKRRVAPDIAAAVATIVRSRPYRIQFVKTGAPCVPPAHKLYFDDGCLVFSGVPPNVHWDEVLRRSYIDLSAANLSGLLLYSPQNLGAVSLTLANLERAALIECQLIATSLIGARLVDADLENARLNLANLDSANFERAILKGADLRRASLRKTILRGADLTGAQLRGVDLRTVVGLTKGQLASALTDEATKVPDYLR